MATFAAQLFTGAIESPNNINSVKMGFGQSIQGQNPVTYRLG